MTTAAPSAPPLSTTLRSAAEALRRRGWHRGEFCTDETDSSSALCLVGALHVAAGVAPWDVDGARRLGCWRLYGAVLDESGIDCDETAQHVDQLTRWADDGSRTLGDLLGVLEAAAQACEMAPAALS